MTSFVNKPIRISGNKKNITTKIKNSVGGKLSLNEVDLKKNQKPQWLGLIADETQVNKALVSWRINRSK